MQDNTIKNFDEILTVSEVSTLLKLHRSTISRYAKSGELKSHKIGARRLFKKQDVLVFFDNRIAPEYVSRRQHGNS